MYVFNTLSLYTLLSNYIRLISPREHAKYFQYKYIHTYNARFESLNVNLNSKFQSQGSSSWQDNSKFGANPWSGNPHIV